MGLCSGPYPTTRVRIGKSSGTSTHARRTKEGFMLRRCPGFLTAWLLVLISTSAFAQGGRSEINGTVFDSAKAVMPGVTITVIDERTGLERTVVSSGEGRFVIPTLVPSTYTIKAELQGFQASTQTGLVLNVGQELTVHLT